MLQLDLLQVLFHGLSCKAGLNSLCNRLKENCSQYKYQVSILLGGSMNWIQPSLLLLLVQGFIPLSPPISCTSELPREDLFFGLPMHLPPSSSSFHGLFWLISSLNYFEHILSLSPNMNYMRYNSYIIGALLLGWSSYILFCSS